MKKSNRFLPVIAALGILTWSASQAQVAMNNPRHPSPGERVGFFSKTPNGASAEVNQKAARNFNKSYQLANAAEWSTLKDNTLLCRFSMNSILYRAFYTSQGNWIYTVSGYDASLLNKNIYNQVKSVYYNSCLVFVNQIDQVKAETIYIIEVRDEKSIKKVRVQGDDMQEVSEFVK